MKATGAAITAGIGATSAGVANLANTPQFPGASSGMMDVFNALQSNFQESISPGDAEALGLLREQAEQERKNQFKSYINSPGLSPAMIETLTAANKKEQDKMRAEASRAATSEEINEGMRMSEDRQNRESVANATADAITKMNMQAKNFERNMRAQQFESFNKMMVSVSKMMSAAIKADSLKKERPQAPVIPTNLSQIAESITFQKIDQSKIRKSPVDYTDDTPALRDFQQRPPTYQAENVQEIPEEEFEDLVVEVDPVRAKVRQNAINRIKEKEDSELELVEFLSGKAGAENRFAKYMKQTISSKSAEEMKKQMNDIIDKIASGEK